MESPVSDFNGALGRDGEVKHLNILAAKRDIAGNRAVKGDGYVAPFKLNCVSFGAGIHSGSVNSNIKAVGFALGLNVRR